MKLGLSVLMYQDLTPMTALARRLQARNHNLVFLHASGPLSAQTIPSLELFRTPLEPLVTRVSLRRQLRPRSRQLGQNHLSAKCS
jgi:hypothetical protein